MKSSGAFKVTCPPTDVQSGGLRCIRPGGDSVKLLCGTYRKEWSNAVTNNGDMCATPSSGYRYSVQSCVSRILNWKYIGRGPRPNWAFYLHCDHISFFQRRLGNFVLSMNRGQFRSFDESWTLSPFRRTWAISFFRRSLGL